MVYNKYIAELCKLIKCDISHSILHQSRRSYPRYNRTNETYMMVYKYLVGGWIFTAGIALLNFKSKLIYRVIILIFLYYYVRLIYAVLTHIISP